MIVLEVVKLLVGCDFVIWEKGVGWIVDWYWFNKDIVKSWLSKFLDLVFVKVCE